MNKKESMNLNHYTVHLYDIAGVWLTSIAVTLPSAAEDMQQRKEAIEEAKRLYRKMFPEADMKQYKFVAELRTDAA